MRKSVTGGCVTAVTVMADTPPTPLGAVAEIDVVPSETAVTTPVPLTVATSGFELFHVNATPAIGALPMSNAAAVSEIEEPTETVALAGEIVTLATSGSGGVSPSSLHAPKVLAASAQTPAASRCRERPTGVDVVCAAPMSAVVRPAAGPLVAA